MALRDLYVAEGVGSPSSGWVEPAGLPAALRRHQQTFDTSTLPRSSHERIPSERRTSSRQGDGEVVETYRYTNAQGEVLYLVDRFKPKRFRQRRPDGRGGFVWNLTGVERVLFRLPEVLDAVACGRRVFICEGEKDVHALARAGVVATTCAGGASGWAKVVDHACEVLSGADVVVVADRDEVGLRHAHNVERTLSEHAASVLVVYPLHGKDAHDHLTTGFDVRDFVGVDGDDDRPTHPLARRSKRYKIKVAR